MNLRKNLIAVAFAAVAAVAAPAFADNHGNHSAPTIVGVASTNADFETLTAALTAAGLVETLEGPGPFTVFAPTDEAFAKLPAGTVEDLLKPENKAKLTAILTYHVVPGNVLAADVVKLDQRQDGQRRRGEDRRRRRQGQGRRRQRRRHRHQGQQRRDPRDRQRDPAPGLIAPYRARRVSRRA